MSLPKKIALFLAVFAVLGGAFIINVPKAKAVTIGELQAQIDDLLKQLATLQSQLAEMQGTTTGWCYAFTRDLKYGVGGEEVRALQTALQKQGFYNRDITGNFDEYTASAVVGFQEKYASEILTPWRLSHGTGFVGRTTRAKLNALYEYKVTPSITVLSPNGGESFIQGSNNKISWISNNLPADQTLVHLFLISETSELGYINYTPVTPPNVYGHTCGSYRLSATGEYTWDGKTVCRNSYIVNISPSDYKVDARLFSWPNTANPVINIASDYSDNYFSIVAAPTKPSITVLSPNGGEQWVIGNTYTIKWTTSNISSGAIIGLAYVPIGSLSGISIGIDSNQNTGSYNWTIPNTVIPGQYYIQATQVKDVGVGPSDKSDVPFSIVAAGTPSITVLSPNGGEQWVAGNSYNITWESAGITSQDRIDIAWLDYSASPLREGYIVYNLAGNLGVYSWAIPSNHSLGSKYKIRVGACTPAGNCYFGLSDNYFSIVAAPTKPSITVLSPNGGEEWVRGNKQTVTWHANSLDYVTIYFEKTDGTLYSINRVYSPQEEYSWTVGSHMTELAISVVPGEYKIKIDGIRNNPYAFVSDESDNYFSIVAAPTKPSITVLSPNGGEEWVRGNTYTIKWTTSNISSGAIIGLAYVPIGSLSGIGIDSNQNTGSYNWTIPNTVIPGQYYIQATQVKDVGVGPSDKSDVPFSIVEAATLGVNLSPQTPASHEVAAGASYFPIGASSEVAHKFLSFEIDNPSSHSVSVNRLAVAIEGTAKPADFGDVIWQADGRLVDSGSNTFREVGGAGYAETPSSLYYPSGATLLTIPANSKKTIEVFAYVKSTATVGATAKFTMYANFVRAVEGFNFGGLPISGNTMTISKKSLSAEIKYQGVHNISAKAGSNLSAPVTIANKSSEEIKITEAVMGDPANANNFLTYTDKNNYTIQYYDQNGILQTTQLRDAGKNTSDGYRLFTISPGLTIPVGKEISFTVSAKLNSVVSVKELTIIFNRFSGYGSITFSPVASVGKVTGKINITQPATGLMDIENSLASVYNAISALIDALRQGQVEK